MDTPVDTSVHMTAYPGAQPAFWRRLAAALVDLVIVVLIYLVVYIIAAVIRERAALAIAGPLFFATVSSYLLTFWAKKGATPGKSLLGLRIVRRGGGNLTLRDVLIRWIGYWLDVLSLGLGFLWAFFGSRRGWHDYMAQTQVVYSAGKQASNHPAPVLPGSTTRPSNLRPGGEPTEQLAALESQALDFAATPPVTGREAEVRLSQIDAREHELESVIRGLSTRDFPPESDRIDHRIRAAIARWRFHAWVTRRRDVTEEYLRMAVNDANGVIWRSRLEVAEPTAAVHELAKVFDGIGGHIAVENRVAYIEVPAPANAVATVVTERRKTKQGTKVVSRQRSQRDINEDYKDIVAEYARKVIQLGLETVPGLNGVSVSLTQSTIHPTLGHAYIRCILAVLADRPTWERIIHPNVSAENALRNFDLHFQYKHDFSLQDATPVVAPSAGTSTGPESLHTMDPLAFEGLVKDLLIRMGFRATLTKASHDGGIDVEAVNPQPIVGGRVIVQCKRYSGTIGASIVRDLYGAVMSARVTKGILITTSDFSADARSFAEDKPLELINGEQLRQLLQRHGFAAGQSA